ncbi:GIN domain-containing protein [Mucilaginibacter polytrichastri]|uniref:Putative auto-transporter adhesin head GIN domain-containing protein n=1 Tax=Mucilaginibacter polytrichastri TaxID=1302689 RepID=A0A1Q6A097_9SPHI|nr:DUF2807 domain-containing protein [Mucilaginibacter polytrichastri]OKS87439.1 hypothetical protein RG47T_2900 [Mucilaginibacter polytrichastri]SFS90659.1 hypothetical protein SAMN04487890_10635 [Mucilaginibacter polytrichastri]
MKTQILTIATVLSLALATSTNTFAANHSNNVSTVLTDVKHISKIEVRGNVELYVSDGATDNVKVYDKYYSESALVQNQNGVLRISSYKNEKLVVWVTAAELQSISAYDNASVKSFGKLSGINLDVNLYNHAAANLNMEAYSANINVNDQATANLTGTVNDFNLKYNQSATVNSSNLVATNLSRKVSYDGFAKAEQVAGL